eukprot:gene17729-19501_t
MATVVSPLSGGVFQLSGKVKFTSFRNPTTSSLQPGVLKLELTNPDKWFISVDCRGTNRLSMRQTKKFKLNDNIKQIMASERNLTLVLDDGYQIIAKDCQSKDVKIFQQCLEKIKLGRLSKAASTKLISSAVSEEDIDPFGIFNDIKETHCKIIASLPKSILFAARPPNLMYKSSSLTSPFASRMKLQNSKKPPLSSTPLHRGSNYSLSLSNTPKRKQLSFTSDAPVTKTLSSKLLSSSSRNTASSKLFTHSPTSGKPAFTFRSQPSDSNSKLVASKPLSEVADESPKSQIAFTGFTNLGNTCYMNAVLQCLLGVKTFSQDLDDREILRNVEETSLYRSLYRLLDAQGMEKKYLLRNIKRAISRQATHFSGYMQHDAHEFLGQCLDQLKIEAVGESKSGQETETHSSCPVGRNFEFVISHIIECKNCGNTITKDENFNDVSLDIPDLDENVNPEERHLQQLLEDYFKNESVNYTCEACSCKSARLIHHFQKLPRVIILHLKRYSIKCKKKLDTVDVPKVLNLGVLCTEKTGDPAVFEQRAVSSSKRILSNETADDIEDFQSSLKVRRKLSLTSKPQISKADETDRFSEDMEKAKKLSLENMNLESMTEEEQFELALMESVKTNDIQPWNDDDLIDLPPDLFDESPSTQKGRQREDATMTDGESNFTSVRTKKNTDQPSEKNEFESVKLVERDVSLRKDSDSKQSRVLIVDSDEDQLSKALEISLQEFNQFSASKDANSQRKRKLEENRSDNVKKSRPATLQNTDVSPPKNYKLIGIISHIGNSLESGHYISDVFDFKEQIWKSYNDSAVKKVTEYEVRYGRKKSAYIFFYIHEDCLKAFK